MSSSYIVTAIMTVARVEASVRITMVVLMSFVMTYVVPVAIRMRTAESPARSLILSMPIPKGIMRKRYKFSSVLEGGRARGLDGHDATLTRWRSGVRIPAGPPVTNFAFAKFDQGS